VLIGKRPKENRTGSKSGCRLLRRVLWTVFEDSIARSTVVFPQLQVEIATYFDRQLVIKDTVLRQTSMDI
jgi:hypothetical protein